jgi:hypothetical protein
MDCHTLRTELAEGHTGPAAPRLPAAKGGGPGALVSGSLAQDEAGGKIGRSIPRSSSALALSSQIIPTPILF